MGNSCRYESPTIECWKPTSTMTWIMVDVETDGPCPGIYSMISIGAVAVEEGLKRRFKVDLAPISEEWVPEALAVSGVSRSQCLSFPSAAASMRSFQGWLENVCRARKGRISSSPKFISDNNGFDWQFVNYYFHTYCGHNPFGYSSQNLGSLYKGMKKSTFSNFKHLRTTAHTHNPLGDAVGNAGAMLAMVEMGLSISKPQ